MSNTDKEKLFVLGVELSEAFCRQNEIPMPGVKRLATTDRLYHLATCAFYRPTTITIMVEKCAARGHAGRAWSWPGYAIDRTPYGVMQHELGHHVDHYRASLTGRLFSKEVYELSREDQMTGYLGTDKQANTFFMEWFAEIFRVFVTNPDLCKQLRPKFFSAMTETFKFKPIATRDWEGELIHHGAPSRIIEQARKKIQSVKS